MRINREIFRLILLSLFKSFRYVGSVDKNFIEFKVKFCIFVETLILADTFDFRFPKIIEQQFAIW